MDYFIAARTNMVKNQVMPNHVSSSDLLAAMLAVPRHEFVEGQWQQVAYCDGRLPLDEGRWMLAPEVIARMIQALNLTSKCRVLDIACGTGYSSALLAHLSEHVTAIESLASLATKAASILLKMKISNIIVKTAALFVEVSANTQFNGILVNGAVKGVVPQLLKQLADGGRLVVIERLGEEVAKAVLYENCKGSIGRIELFDAYGDFL